MASRPAALLGSVKVMEQRLRKLKQDKQATCDRCPWVGTPGVNIWVVASEGAKHVREAHSTEPVRR